MMPGGTYKKEHFGFQDHSWCPRRCNWWRTGRDGEAKLNIPFQLCCLVWEQLQLHDMHTVPENVCRCSQQLGEGYKCVGFKRWSCNSCFEEFLQNLKLIRFPLSCIFRCHFQLKGLVGFGTKSYSAFQGICLEHDYTRFIGIDQLQRFLLDNSLKVSSHDDRAKESLEWGTKVTTCQARHKAWRWRG